MVGNIIQMASLVSIGNGILRHGFPLREFTVDDGLCNKINFFFPLKGKKSEWENTKEIASDPYEWLAYESKAGCLKMKIGHRESGENPLNVPDYKLAGLVGGGGEWYILAIHPEKSEFWISKQKVTDENNPEHKIWTYSYVRSDEFPTTPEFTNPDLFQAGMELKTSLSAIWEFAKKQKLDPWQGIFSDALKILERNASDEEEFYQKIMPLKYFTPEAKKIFLGASRAWVFGAMGWWNDLGFEDKKEQDDYENLTADLFEKVNNAIIASVNSFE